MKMRGRDDVGGGGYSSPKAGLQRPKKKRGKLLKRSEGQ